MTVLNPLDQNQASLINAKHSTKQNTAPKAAPTGSHRSRQEVVSQHASEAAEVRRMAVLTALCLLTLVAGWAGENYAHFPRWVFLSLYGCAYLSGGLYSTAQAISELRSGALKVDLLMVLAALGAAAIGEYPEGAVLLFLFSLSSTLEQHVLGRTRRAITALMDLSPDFAVVRRNGQEERIPVEELRLDDVVIVRPAERIPADGVIVSGQTSVNQAAMTGESLPVDKAPGDPVFAATLNQQGAIEVRVKRIAGDTTLARIVRLVEEAQSEKAQSERFTDWFGQRYTIGVLVLATLTFVVPFVFLGEQHFIHAFYRAMTVLVVASPCAVVISIPAAILAAITGAARNGVLFKGGAHLERTATVRAIAFDKTGTLTMGTPHVVEVLAVGDMTQEELLRLAAGVESLSEHPLAQAVVAAAREKGIPIPAATDVEALVGRGVQARVEGRMLLASRLQLFAERGHALPPQITSEVERLTASGTTAVVIGDQTQVLGLIAIRDTLRPSAQEAIKALRAAGIEHMVMLTGDNKQVAQAIAAPLGIAFEAELMPQDKLRIIQNLKQQYSSVAMVGDGINDAPSLASATVGITLGGSGTDVALETADVVLMADDLEHLAYALRLSQQAMRIIKQNLIFAFGMMTLLLGVTFFGNLPLPLAVVGHEGSTVLVIFNGLRLLSFPRQNPA